MPKILYISCSSRSGSTLCSFLLNEHSEITTVGHMGGWQYADNEVFHCSCGKQIERCPLFLSIAQTFEAQSLPFDFRNFGTRYSVTQNSRLNRYLTAGLPLIESSGVEKLRDAIVRTVPSWRRTLMLRNRANLAFVNAALEYSGAQVFVDNSHGPHRLRFLRSIHEFEVTPVHLVRDFRGVALSYMKSHNWDASTAARVWLARQSEILRVFAEFPRTMRVYYEDLASMPNETVMKIHKFVGLRSESLPEAIPTHEHHILGNRMRLQNMTIAPDNRWRRELSDKERSILEDRAIAYARKNGNGRLSELIEHYLALH